MSDDPLKECPECKKEALKKIIKSTGGFQLKGSGWFKDGY
jgi:putative FmdB family regulatory protein